MDEVFKAINDPSRRALLDSLFASDGQSLNELAELLPSMTRQGTMSHLRVLEEANLISTKKVGRSKLHYLNPVPIRLIHDRWITKYTEPLVGVIAGLKHRLEEPMADSTPVHIYRAYINAPRDRVWSAITDGDQTVQYFYGTRVASDWAAGSELVYTYPDGSVAADGTVIAIDAPSRLEMTFHARWDPELAAEGPAREVWTLNEVNGMTELTIELYDIAVDGATYRDFTNGFPYIVSGMKSLLETGQALPAPY